MSANLLKDETSPYLLQHADNPVNWYPWGDAALEKARKEDRPILLSIGYSACHWCHIMAHESFEDAETAALMNAQFINIKVDREERPDLDKIYQTAHQLLTQRAGGWPLTLFLTPDKQIPFFAGTYFPKHPRYGLPSFKDMLYGIAGFYRDRRSEIEQQNISLLNAMKGMVARSNREATAITRRPLALCMQQMQQGFDAIHGGFDGAPKFPQPSRLELLLREYAEAVVAGDADNHAWDMAALTLRNMANGGIFDQLGGGFCRYSVDEQWMIPHFEKMLYDNGQLLDLYSTAWQISREPLFARTVQATAEWVLREMQSPEGGYYSSLDADTQQGEGEFYVWDRDQISSPLTEDEFTLFALRFGLNRAPNFEGKWHLHGYADVVAIAQDTGMAEDNVRALLDSARIKLLAVRSTRMPPGRDEKILTSWNSLMIKGMAKAGLVFNQSAWIVSAQRALDCIKQHLWVDGRLLATCKDGRAHLPAYLDDYAFLIDAILALLAVRWREDDMNLAIQLADSLLAGFEDKDDGGFFFTAHDHEELFHRPKQAYDDAMPSGNSTAARVLGRLGHLLGESRYLEAAEGVISAFWSELERMPDAHGSMLIALRDYQAPPKIVILRGEHAELVTWSERANKNYAPGRITMAIPSDAGLLPQGLQQRAAKGPIAAYVCAGFQCGPIITDPAIFDSEMSQGEVSVD